jgi:hypothetical protein
MEARKRVAAENGTVVMDATKNPYLVMQGMGHEELDTTMLYMHNDVMQLQAVIDKRKQFVHLCD